MKIEVTITPGLSPMDRGWVEDELAERFGGEDVVEFLGGGTMLGDPPVSDFELGLPEDLDADAVTRTCREFLSAIPFTIETTIELQVGDGAKQVITIAGEPEDQEPS